jgi:hypothetical protein
LGLFFTRLHIIRAKFNVFLDSIALLSITTVSTEFCDDHEPLPRQGMARDATRDEARKESVVTDYTWSSALSGNWSTTSDWNPNGVPGSVGGDTATINATGLNYVVTYDEPSESINNLTINSANATLTLGAGGSLTVFGSTMLTAGTINVMGANVSGGNLTTAAGTTINVGNSGTLQNSTTVYTANLSGLIDITGSGAALGSGSLGVTLNNTGTIEATGGVGTLNFAGTITGSGTLEANGATLNVIGSLANTSANIVISDSASSLFESSGSVFFGAQMSATFLGPHGEFEYNNKAADGHAIFNLTGLNAGASATTSTNFFDFGNETLTISVGGTGAGTTGSIVMSNSDTLALSGITGVGPGGWKAVAQSDGSNGTEVFLQSICYAAGTHILTASGERRIENLLPGDAIATLSGQEVVHRPLRWIGQRHINLAAHPRPRAVAPIRILRHAIADAVPHSDLLVSPDHGILIDGKLVCARQLINGGTVRQETDRNAVTYYHLEFDVHAILLAEGAPAESYLDTGNRDFFSNAGVPVQLHPDLSDESGNRTREASSCMPFVSNEDSVRPIWQRLADRARTLGLMPPAPDLTKDPDLRVTADGRACKLLSRTGDRYVFALARHASEPRICSRVATPTDTRPWLDDRRSLGVCVSRIVLRNPAGEHELSVDHPALTLGWWDVESDGGSLRRWTTGDALLRIPPGMTPCLMEIHAIGLAYPISDGAGAASLNPMCPISRARPASFDVGAERAVAA